MAIIKFHFILNSYVQFLIPFASTNTHMAGILSWPCLCLIAHKANISASFPLTWCLFWQLDVRV